MFPGVTSLWNGKATLSTPFADPNLLSPTRTGRSGQYHRLTATPECRQGNIHFAGEHCSMDFQGFMEGGAAEGIRAATRCSTR